MTFAEPLCSTLVREKHGATVILTNLMQIQPDTFVDNKDIIIDVDVKQESTWEGMHIEDGKNA